MAARDLDSELDAIARGDADAFARWLAGAEHELRASLRAAAALVDAEAVLQEGLLRVWQVAPRFRRDGKPNGLLRLGVTVLRNLVHSELRRTRPELASDDVLAEIRLPSGAEDPPLPDPLLRRAIQKCREKLPQKPAAALAARLEGAGGKDDEELAASLGMRLNTFLQNFTRARRLLAECLGRAGIRVEEL